MPAEALASNFSGSADPAGTVGFKLVRPAGALKVKDFAVHGIPVHCSDGSFKASGQLTYKVAVKAGTFAATADDGSGSSFVVSGKLVQQRRRAKGTVRIHGSSVPTDDGHRHTSCDSGQVPFNAKRT